MATEPLRDRLNRQLRQAMRLALQRQADWDNSTPEERAAAIERIRQKVMRGIERESLPARVPSCATCRDNGHVRIPPRSRAEWPGRTVLCPHCGTGRQHARIRATYPLPPAIRRLAHADFLWVPGMAEASLATQRYIQHRPDGVIVALDGGYGVGKTHLLAAMYEATWQRDLTAIYTTGPALERFFLDFDDSDEAVATRAQTWKDMSTVDLLLIDEADRVKQTEDGNGWVERRMFDLVDERLQHERSSVLAGNNLAERLHPAIQSRARACDGWWIDLHHAPDMRPHFARAAPGWKHE